jgi:hypothetical protein
MRKRKGRSEKRGGGSKTESSDVAIGWEFSDNVTADLSGNITVESLLT